MIAGGIRLTVSDYPMAEKLSREAVRQGRRYIFISDWIRVWDGSVSPMFRKA